MTQFNTLVEEMKREAREKLVPVCIDPTCDGNGVAVVGNPEEPEPMQCQYCYQERFPLMSRVDTLITTTATRVREETIEEVKEAFRKLCTVNNDGDCKYFKDELHKDLLNGSKFVAQEILNDILSTLNK